MTNHDDDATIGAYLAAFEDAEPVDLVGTPKVVVERTVVMPCAVLTRTDLSHASSGGADVRSFTAGLLPAMSRLVGTRGTATATA